MLVLGCRVSDNILRGKYRVQGVYGVVASVEMAPGPTPFAPDRSGWKNGLE